MSKPMMKCGHSANAWSASGPCCTICAGIKAGFDQIVEAPNLEGRKARCGYYSFQKGECKSEVDSSTDLPYFERRPSQEFDSYYCGCMGWN